MKKKQPPRPLPVKILAMPTTQSFLFFRGVNIKLGEKLYSKMSYEPLHDKTNKMAYAPSEDSDQPGHPPSLIRVFAVRMKKGWDP